MESTLHVAFIIGHNHLGPFDMQRNNGMKFSRDRKNYINFQLDVLGEGWGYFENVQWTFCIKRIDLCAVPK